MKIERYSEIDDSYEIIDFKDLRKDVQEKSIGRFIAKDNLIHEGGCVEVQDGDGNTIRWTIALVVCDRCDQDLPTNERWDLPDTVFDRGYTTCQKCLKKAKINNWMDEVEEKCRELAGQHGWDFELKNVASTGTRYYDLFREFVNKDGDDDYEEFKLRISDHGSAHCTEDISLAMDECIDDHSFQAFENRITSKVGA